MTGPDPTQLGDLGPAGEPVRLDQRARRGRAQRRQELFLRAGHRHLVVAGLEAEVPGEAAAASGGLAHESGALAQPAVRGVAEDGVLVAVGLADERTVEAGRSPGRRVLLQGLRDGPYGRRQAGRAGVVGEQGGQVGAQGGGAARFEDGDGSGDLAEGVQGAAQDLAGAVEAAGGEVGQAAADPAAAAGDGDVQAGRPEDEERGAADLGGEVLREGVGPQGDNRPGPGSGSAGPLWPGLRPGPGPGPRGPSGQTLTRAPCERALREVRQGSFAGQAGQRDRQVARGRVDGARRP